MEKVFFILPFTIGLTFILSFLIVITVIWLIGFSKIDKLRIIKSIPTRKTLVAIREVFMESLIHRKIFLKNPILGYMHMSLAFGWFLLIIVGHLEAAIYHGTLFFPFWQAVFFRYFVTASDTSLLSKMISATMDFLLLFILSGVFLAYYKRINKRIFGLKKTTNLKIGDRFALTALWAIFPLRLFAESVTAGIHQNGSFLTQPLGNLLNNFVPLSTFENASWLAYSLSLGVFFVALPVSRYMHIPVEILLIFLRNYGIRMKKKVGTYSRVQVFSCSRCGICLDSCQMTDAGIKSSQSVYIVKQIRNRNLTDEKLFNCLLCGKCQTDCPVGLELNNLRITQRIESTLEYNSSYDYLTNGIYKEQDAIDIIYFAGCMTHLTPAIIKSMKGIFNHAGVKFWFMDEDKTACCGRPLIQIGQYKAAQKLIEHNKERILHSGAKKLVVSCPICYTVFKEDYALPGIQVLHHSEYLLELMAEKKIPTNRLPMKVVYHDPCELGRGNGIYLQPRILLDEYAELVQMKHEKEEAYCCGGSLSNIKIQSIERDLIRDKVISEYMSYQPDVLATACPLCKKTFAKNRDIPVHDIAELVYMSICKTSKPIMKKEEKAIRYEEIFQDK